MVAAIIIGIVLCLLSGILMIPLSIRLTYDEALSVKWQVAWFSFPLYPASKKHKKKEKTQKRGKRKAEASPAPTKKKKGSISHYIQLITCILKRIYKKFSGCFTIHVKRFEVVVASEDPAKTAILYGVTTQSVAYLFTILEQLFRVKKTARAQLSVNPDFLSTDWQIAVDIRLSSRVFSLLRVLIHALFAFRSTQRELKQPSLNNQI